MKAPHVCAVVVCRKRGATDTVRTYGRTDGRITRSMKKLSINPGTLGKNLSEVRETAVTCFFCLYCEKPASLQMNPLAAAGCLRRVGVCYGTGLNDTQRRVRAMDVIRIYRPMVIHAAVGEQNSRPLPTKTIVVLTSVRSQALC